MVDVHVLLNLLSLGMFLCLPDSMHKLCEDTLIQTCALRNDVYNRAENDLQDSIQFNSIQFKIQFKRNAQAHKKRTV